MRGLLALAVVCAAVAYANPSDVFSSQDASRLAKLVNAAQAKDGSFGTPAQTFAALSALNELNQPATTTALCGTLKTQLAAVKSSDLKTLYYTVAAFEEAKCGAPIVTSFTSSLQSGLKSSALSDLYYASQTVIVLASNKHADLSQFDFANTIKRVVDLADDDGGYASRPESGDANAVNAGLALQIIGSVLRAVPSVAGSSKADVHTAVENVEDLLDLGGSSGEVDFTEGSGLSGLVAASTVLKGIESLATAQSEKLDVTEAQLNRIAAFFVSSKYVQSAEDAAALTSSLRILAKNSIHVPLVVALTSTDTANLKVKVTNVLDKFVASATVSLALAFSDDKSATVVARDVAFTPAAATADNTEYVLKGQADAWKKAAPGFYSLRVTVDPTKADNLKPTTAVLKGVKVFAEVAITDFSVSVSESAKGLETDKVHTTKYPAKLASKVSAEGNRYLHVKLTLKSSAKFEASQVFVQLSSASLKKSAVFVATSADKGEHYSLRIALGSTEAQEALFGPGDYEVHVLVGDALLAKSIRWQAGDFSLQLPAPDAAAADSNAVPAEIHHQFRAAEDRPGSFIAMIGTVAACLPLLGLVFALLQAVHWNFFPSGFVQRVAFVASLGFFLFLYVAYWLWLNIFEALFWVALGGVVLTVTGAGALSSLHKERAVRPHTE